MKQLDIILQRLTIFYYIFLTMTIISVVVAFYFGVSEGLREAQISHVELGTLNMVIFMTMSTILLITGVWLMVLFVKMLILIGSSIKHKDVFNLKLVKMIYRFLVLYVVTICCAYINMTVKGTPLELRGWVLVVDFLSNVSLVVMLLMFCEVLKIGHILKSEQDLTV